jgi:hypothetical protein
MKGQKLPSQIIDYVNDHFREDFLLEVKEVRKTSTGWVYSIEVSKDNFIHKLRFNQNGSIVSGNSEEAFPADNHEGPSFETIPD